MPIIRQTRILRTDLQANPNVYYVFGDNFQRRGYGGQAAECRDEPNAIGIPTKHAPYNNTAAYFKDAEHDEIVPELTKVFTRIEDLLRQGKIVVFPSAEVGTGYAMLDTKAPRIAYFIVCAIARLEQLYNVEK